MNAGEVATKLDIAKDTLRAYSLELEKAGYEFKRNNRNQRDYSDYDLSILNAFLTLSKTYGLTLKEAASKVSSSDFKPSKRLEGTILVHIRCERRLDIIITNKTKTWRCCSNYLITQRHLLP